VRRARDEDVQFDSRRRRRGGGGAIPSPRGAASEKRTNAQDGRGRAFSSSVRTRVRLGVDSRLIYRLPNSQVSFRLVTFREKSDEKTRRVDAFFYYTNIVLNMCEQLKYKFVQLRVVAV
jgi:hypothetical protein